MTEINWNAFPNFEEKEFFCPCCGKQKMNPITVRHLQQARTMAGTPLTINSAWRCKDHNKKVGGVPNSAHLTGHAVDIHCVDSSLRYDMIEALLAVGFTRIIVYPTFIHVDDAQDRYLFLIKP